MLQVPVSGDLENKIDKAVQSIREFDGVVVALSAGVDSSLVALLAKRALGDHAVAATAVSESLPPGELDVAKRTAEEIGIRHLLVGTNELQNPNYASNTSNRCYYCKDTLYKELRTVANDLGLETILDGTHLDDLGDDRPGLLAAQGAGVVSPLLKAGFTKKDIREAAKISGLSVWDKPAMPCLSSRIPHGERVTVEKLSAIGQAELFIKQVTGVRELRVRHESGLARIEVSPRERHLLYSELLMDQIDERLRTLGFSKVTLDLGGYRRSGPPASKDEVILPVLNSV